MERTPPQSCGRLEILLQIQIITELRSEMANDLNTVYMGPNPANFDCAALWVMLLGKSVDVCIIVLGFLKTQSQLSVVGRKKLCSQFR